MVAPIFRPVPALSTPAAERAALSRREALHDAGLVRRFNDGDEAAFVEIVTRYRAKMLVIALGLLHNRADAEEIAQDTFIRAHRGLAKFRGDASLAAWLYRITLNLARNRYWYFFRRRRHATLSLDCQLGSENESTFAELIAADAPNPAQENTRSEFSELIAACMEKLDASHREILTLRQTGKMDDALPVVLYDSKFWNSLINFQNFVDTGMVAKRDLDLFGFADTPRQAWEQLVKRGLKAPGVTA